MDKEDGIRLFSIKTIKREVQEPKLKVCVHNKRVVKAVIKEEIILNGDKQLVGDLCLECDKKCGWEDVKTRFLLSSIVFDSTVKIVDER